MAFTNEQLRVLENVAVLHDEMMDTARRLRAAGPPLIWKTVSGREYLYELTDRRGNARSLGRRGADTEARYQEVAQVRDEGVRRMTALRQTAREMLSVYRALRLPMVDPTTAEILREADIRRALGNQLLLIGTAGMPAYELEAQSRFLSGLDSTEDCDFTWCDGAVLASREPVSLLEILKSVDNTFTVNTERTFQARNAKAYEVDLLTASTDTYPSTERLRPLVSPEQAILHLGRPLEQVAMSRDGKTVRLVVPDPRAMALHKLWLADQPSRNPRKREKDRAQGAALLQELERGLSHFPMSTEFRSKLTPSVRPYLPPDGADLESPAP